MQHFPHSSQYRLPLPLTHLFPPRLPRLLPPPSGKKARRCIVQRHQPTNQPPRHLHSRLPSLLERRRIPLSHQHTRISDILGLSDHPSQETCNLFITRHILHANRGEEQWEEVDVFNPPDLTRYKFAIPLRGAPWALNISSQRLARDVALPRVV